MTIMNRIEKFVHKVCGPPTPSLEERKQEKDGTYLCSFPKYYDCYTGRSRPSGDRCPTCGGPMHELWY